MHPTQIYHMVAVPRWQSWPVDTDYLPAEYANDGFVHCTAGDELMVAVANRFYRNVAGEFMVLVIDTTRLTSPLLWEAPQPGDTLAPLFPHIYGPITAAAIIGTKVMHRAPDGTFLHIT